MFFPTITIFSLLALGVVDARAAPYPSKDIARRDKITTPFGDKDRDIEPLPEAYQPDDGHGVIYTISQGYEDPKANNSLVPAVVIIFSRPDKDKNGNETEARKKQDRLVRQTGNNAEQAGQFLFYDNTKESYLFLVLRNPQKDFPTSGSSELKMFHQLYIDDKNMNVTEKLTKARELGHAELLRLAKEKKRIRHKYGIKTAMMDSGFTRIVFFDWEPETINSGLFGFSTVREGVVEISRQDESQETTDYEASLKADNNKGFTLSDLNDLLKTRMQTLRPNDSAALKAELEAAAKKKAEEDAKNSQRKRSGRLL